MSEVRHGGKRVPGDGKKLGSTKVERLAKQERENHSGVASIASIFGKANSSASSASDASVGGVRPRPAGGTPTKEAVKSPRGASAAGSSSEPAWWAGEDGSSDVQFAGERTRADRDAEMSV